MRTMERIHDPATIFSILRTSRQIIHCAKSILFVEQYRDQNIIIISAILFSHSIPSLGPSGVGLVDSIDQILSAPLFI